MIGVLRADRAGDDWADDAPERPQPTLVDLPELVDESRRAGIRVRLECRVADPATVPVAVGRGAYRIAQEGPTNARKHAHGAEVSVTVRGARSDGLTVEICNPWPVDAAGTTAIPGAGSGDEYVLRALRAGASGFLLKDTRPTEILHAISGVAAGEPILSPAVTRQLIAHVGTTGADARQRHAPTMLAKLSAREREVAVAVGRGRSNAQISDELYMSVATVKAHVSSILTKLDLNNRTQIALLVHDAGPPS